MDLKELERGVNPNVHWYYQAKKRPLIRFVQERLRREAKGELVIVDVGAGSGFFALELVRRFPDRIKKVFLVDPNYSDEEVNFTAGQVAEKTKELPEVIENAVVIMMDVLEHVEDDLALTRSVVSRCRGDCSIFITVPAMPQLWSGHDVFLGHYRRYTLANLRSLLSDAGIRSGRCRYLFAALAPVAWIVRRIVNPVHAPRTSLSGCNPALNGMLRAYHAVEMWLMRANSLFGLSLNATGQVSSRRNPNGSNRVHVSTAFGSPSGD